MSGRERRERDPLWLQQVLARLARIRVARAVREVEALRATWPQDNVLERIYLAQAGQHDRKETRREGGR